MLTGPDPIVYFPRSAIEVEVLSPFQRVRWDIEHVRGLFGRRSGKVTSRLTEVEGSITSKVVVNRQVGRHRHSRGD